MILIFLVLLGTAVEGRNCSDNNGGCDHYCIDRSDMTDGFCGCQCYYELDADMQSCSLIDPCDIDILWWFDFGKSVLGFFGCLSVDLDMVPTNLNDFESWRNTTAGYFQAFNTEIDASEYRIATIVSGRESVVTNNYGNLQNASSLQAEIEAIQATNTEVCGDQSVFQDLYKVAIGTSDLVINGAGDAASTTRVALINMVGPLPSNELSSLIVHSDAIHEYFDQVFVIGRITHVGDTHSYTTEHLRMLACRNESQTDCPYLFFVDGVNGNNQTFNRAHVNPMIDTTRCITSRPTFGHSVVCGVSTVTVTIPVCILGGLEESDLQLNDPFCDLTTMSERIGNDIVITITYEQCSWQQTTETIGDHDYVTYTQTVTRHPTTESDSAKTINLDASCQFLRYSQKQLGPLVPIEEGVHATLTVNATFNVSFLLYENSSYISPYSTLPSTIAIFERLYFSVEVTIPSDLKTILTDVQARNTVDGSGINFELFADQCPNDDTFQFEDIAVNDRKRFSLAMFQFTSTVNEPNGAKDPVYIVVSVRLCPTTDTSAACTQSCPTRRRRDVEEDGEHATHTRHLGPFYMEHANQKKEDVKRPGSEGKDNNRHMPLVVTIEMTDASYIELSSIWILITLIAILLATTITRLSSNCSRNETKAHRKTGVEDKGIKHFSDVKSHL